MATAVVVRTEALRSMLFIILTSVLFQQTTNMDICHSWSLSHSYSITTIASVKGNQSTTYLLCFDLVRYSISGRVLLGQHKCTCSSNLKWVLTTTLQLPLNLDCCMIRALTSDGQFGKGRMKTAGAKRGRFHAKREKLERCATAERPPSILISPAKVREKKRKKQKGLSAAPL